jgi:hypothetical protein
MATGLVRNTSIFGLEAESTEGTYVAPSGTGKYLQVMEGVDIKPSREVLDRSLITSSPGREAPKMGMKGAQATIPVEFRAEGTEGTAPDFDKLLLGALGAQRSAATTTTTKASGNTSTVLQIEDADISKFAVGDMVVVKKSGQYELRPISAVATGAGVATITFPFALDGGAPGNSVVVSKFQTYYTADTGHPSLSFTAYWANQIREAVIGAKVVSMALENWGPGKLANWNFGLDALTFTRIDGAAPHTPAYDTGTPPVILNACLFRDGVATPVNKMDLSLTNELGFMSSTCSDNGKTGSRVKSREIKGTFNPYMDDTTVTDFDAWVAGTIFSLFAYAYNPSGTAGQGAMGSFVGIWLPNCVSLDCQAAEVDGIMVNNIPFRATRGANGTLEEMYLGLV